MTEHYGRGLGGFLLQLRQSGGCVQSAGGRLDAPATCRLSLNGVLIPLAGSGMLLGIAHMHRGHRNTLGGRKLPHTVMFGAHHYTHVFFAARPRARATTTLGHSAPDSPAADAALDVTMVGSEFCLGRRRPSQPTAARLDCEVVQYVTGLVQHGDELWITYGANDCTPLLATLPVAMVLDDLRNVTM